MWELLTVNNTGKLLFNDQIAHGKGMRNLRRFLKKWPLSTEEAEESFMNDCRRVMKLICALI